MKARNGASPSSPGSRSTSRTVASQSVAARLPPKPQNAEVVGQVADRPGREPRHAGRGAEQGVADGRLQPPEDALTPVVTGEGGGRGALEGVPVRRRRRATRSGRMDPVTRRPDAFEVEPRRSGAVPRSARPARAPSAPWPRRRTCTGPARKSPRSRRASYATSSKAVRNPSRCASAAVARPPIPPPTTTRSKTSPAHLPHRPLRLPFVPCDHATRLSIGRRRAARR